MLHVLTLSFQTRRSSDLDDVALVASEGTAVELAFDDIGIEEGAQRLEHPAHARDQRIVAPQRMASLHHVVDGEQEQRHPGDQRPARSDEHTSELQSLMRISYAVFCLTKKNLPANLYISTPNHTTSENNYK